MLKILLKKRKKLKLKLLRLEKAETKYVDLLIRFQQIQVALGGMEYDERLHKANLQNYLRERAHADYVV